MCSYETLSQTEFGKIQICTVCNTYVFTYKNLVINYDRPGFLEFKECLRKCYAFNKRSDVDPHYQDIHFNTKIEGMKLRFSRAEVGELLALFQEAYLNNLTEQDLDTLNLT
ncbi:MAG: DUF6686 family protein [Bacteroidota bacterium]